MLTKALASVLKSYAGLVFWLSLSLPTTLSVYSPDRAYRQFTNQEVWVDSVFKTLSPRERIGQLFMIRAHSNLDEKHNLSVEKLILENKVGGLCFFQGGPYRQAKLTNRYQKISKVPLLVSIDGEWGLGMRLDSTISFPRQMTLGAIQEDTLLYQMGAEVGRQFSRLGIHVNFAPVVDINNNPDNPVIGDRSFGEDKNNVARKGIAYMRGMQDNGLLTSAKHFPGHGDTNVDSHYALPIISHSKTRLDDIELYPFKQLINNGLQGTMVAHLQVTAYDNIQTTLSARVVDSLLKNNLKFEGLVYTDALEMKGVADYYAPGELDVKALLAGNDVLLLSGDVPKGILAIENAIQQGKIAWETVNQRVKKVLRAKYRVGLHQYKPVDLKNLDKDLNSAQAYQLQETLYQKSLTLVKNENNFLPIRRLDTLTFASVALGATALYQRNVFQEYLDNYAPFNHYQVAKFAPKFTYDTLFNKLQKQKTVIVSLHSLNKKRIENYNITANELDFIQRLSAKTKVVLVVFGYAYSLKNFNTAQQLVCTYEENWLTQKLAPQLIFGANPAEGKLPVTVSPQIALNAGVKTEALQRLRYGNAWEVGLNLDTLTLADAIVKQAIKNKYIPGGQLLIARKGKVVYHKNYGNFTYQPKSKPVDKYSLYDIASVSKVSGTLSAIMYLYDQGKLDLDKKVADYLPELRNTDKASMTVREVLTHQAGLIPFLKHWARTQLANQRLSPWYYSSRPSPQFPIQVAENIYTIPAIEDSLWKWSIESPIAKSKDSASNLQFYKYEYSDLSFYTLKYLAEKLLNEPMEVFLQRQIFSPLGMSQTTYNPLTRFAKNRIAPTEKDTNFRHQLIQGYVHDQGAAMLGGVGGHAGLFSNVKDLAILMQMHLQNGYYGGTQFWRPETEKLFTQKQYERNRRGLGWDKPDKNSISYIPDFSSPEGFGHSGFTGCVVWADPQSELVMVFLSNRIYPSAENDKLVKEHTRRKILNVVYRAMQK
ncbi:MAG: serine hydrolase [Microscillaceae bacterium]|jgi:beta-glucosidase-like glycosyl hydrolase/CubicO group peptidase (beta-lactamase class C family)|nr:serine hydrolase [Microscillaceae bacterium]